MIASLHQKPPGGVMVVLELLYRVLLIELHQVFVSRYGVWGALCLFFIGVGARARNTACLSAGAVLFVLLMSQA
ncbi:hypothetical protein ACWDA7_11915 [Streptomyces sp. NPDC001156]